jgi:hypothetical protein
MSRPNDRPHEAAAASRGRPKSKLPRDARPTVIALKEWLGNQIGSTPYRIVAERSNYSTTTVSDVLRDSTVPRLQQVLSIARGVDAPQSRARELWFKAAYDDFKATNPKPPLQQDPFGNYGWELRKAMLWDDFRRADLLSQMRLASLKFGSLARPMSPVTLSRLLTGSSRGFPTIVQMDLLFSVLSLHSDELEKLRDQHRILNLALSIAKKLNGDTGKAA